MRITLNANYNHTVTDKQEGNSKNKTLINLKSLFAENLKNEVEHKKGSITWTDNESVEVTGVSLIALHRFILEAEKLGKSIRFEKKTVIEIID